MKVGADRGSNASRISVEWSLTPARRSSASPTGEWRCRLLREDRCGKSLRFRHSLADLPKQGVPGRLRGTHGVLFTRRVGEESLDHRFRLPGSLFKSKLRTCKTRRKGQTPAAVMLFPSHSPMMVRISPQ